MPDVESMIEPKTIIPDVWIARLRLTFEFGITCIVLVGVGIIALNQGTSEAADSGAAAVATLVVGYWFGRAR